MDRGKRGQGGKTGRVRHRGRGRGPQRGMTFFPHSLKWKNLHDMKSKDTRDI